MNFTLYANTMAVRSACGLGISVGTSVTERDTSMARIGRPREWTDSQLNEAKYLMANNFSASKVGKIFSTTKNAVLGALYRDKVRNGYVPPADSKYTVTKNSHKHDPSLGKMKCYVCSKTFNKLGRFDRFCYECRRTGRVV